MKKIIFRVNYCTVSGQSLWVKISLKTGDATIDQLLPMHWLNKNQWETEWEIGRSGKDESLSIRYHYLLRQEGNGVELEEWNQSREAEVHADVGVLMDTWSSAGTVDYTYETKAFDSIVEQGANLSDDEPGNHELLLRMANVPKGQAVCLLGSVAELGSWDVSHPKLMRQISANVWQATVEMEAGHEVEYKYGLYDLEKNSLADLELGENRRFHNPVVKKQSWARISDEAYRRHESQLFRGAGVAVPVFSLRSQRGFGIGEFADLKPLADWASLTGLKMIQILPINDTTSSHTWTDSYPYSAISAFALHPIYLRLDEVRYSMAANALKSFAEVRERLNALPEVDHERVMKTKMEFLRETYGTHRSKILVDSDFLSFVEANREWIIPYAAFCVLRDQMGTADFTQWGDWSVYDPAKVETLEEDVGKWSEMGFHLWLQYELDQQLSEVVEHMHRKGVVLKGDLPIGIDRESVDAWSAPELYHMESQTGAPPDAFAVKGQNWGFPTYDWARMKRNGYAWWRARFAQLSRYFDAYRIDHILGFFRIWQIPYQQIDGIMGWFDPALSIHLNEFSSREIPFEWERFCEPYLREETLSSRFGEDVSFVKAQFLDSQGDGKWRLKPIVDTQRKISELPADERVDCVREALLECVSDVLFFEVPGSEGKEFHPRCGMQLTQSYAALDEGVREKIEVLYNDYFYHRQEVFWQAQGYEKLPAMRRASQMLLCGEDLGMVPACVPGVMKEMGILSLEIQRMPKVWGTRFFNPAHAPYMSVVSPSTHDMETLREWWEADPQATRDFAWEMFGMATAPHELSGELAAKIIDQHLRSPAMWAIFPLQDLFAMDEEIRRPDPHEERINVPAIMPYNWRYRMHLGLEELCTAERFNEHLHALVNASGRGDKSTVS